MFERYTEKARRVIFFARYEASQYGSSVIDTEHILLGLLREDRGLFRHLLGPLDLDTEIRDEIEKAIHRGERVSTSVEMPLTGDAKKILNFAGEEADRLAHRHIGTEHVLLGIFRLPNSLAAKVLLARGAKPNTIREQIARRPVSLAASYTPADVSAVQFLAGSGRTAEALSTLEQFLELLKKGGSGQLANFFDPKGQFIDSSGKRWLGRTEIDEEAETLLAPFAKKNASFRVDDTTVGPSHTLIASVLWEFAAASSESSKSVLRMSIVLAPAGKDWLVVLVQVTPVTFG